MSKWITCETCPHDILGHPNNCQQCLNDAIRSERDRYREALESIKAKLAVTDVPRDGWIRQLHGQLYSYAYYALAPEGGDDEKAVL